MFVGPHLRSARTQDDQDKMKVGSNVLSGVPTNERVLKSTLLSAYPLILSCPLLFAAACPLTTFVRPTWRHLMGTLNSRHACRLSLSLSCPCLSSLKSDPERGSPTRDREGRSRPRNGTNLAREGTNIPRESRPRPAGVGRSVRGGGISISRRRSVGGDSYPSAQIVSARTPTLMS